MIKVSSMFTNVNPIIKSHKITIDYLIYEEQVWLEIIMKISIIEKVIFQTWPNFGLTDFHLISWALQVGSRGSPGQIPMGHGHVLINF
jgi:hypothetical protein